MTDAPHTLTITETHALLDHIIGKGGTHKQYQRRLRNYTMAMVMLEAGLRVGELTRLRWDTLFFNSLPVTFIIITPQISKSKVERQVPVSTRLSDSLSTYHVYFAPPQINTANPAFFRSGKKRLALTTRQVERIIEAASMKALGRPVHPHVLRHTFGTKLMRVAPASVVQQLLGHKHLSSTQVYCHPNNEDLKDAIDKATTTDPTTWHAASDAPRPPGVPKDLDTTDTDRDMR